MIRVSTVLMTLALVGCAAKTGPVAVAMKADATGFEPTSIELQHAEDGWVSVAMTATAERMEKLGGGMKARLANEELPKGEYTAVRVGYVRTITMAPTPKPDATIERETDAEPDAKMERGTKPEAEAEGDAKTMTRTPAEPKTERQEGAVTTNANFCVGKKGGDVMIDVTEQGKKVMLAVTGPEC